ncbi:hypothetical protein [Roseovarius sp.]|uniref:hypothetical protein n=1 Tax=Roseovarius sp. TaxID=1486281 RepID=UPI0026033859|nr:hypothetical protein [Roseovarius sp.]MDM8166974.1 hypothetical protein [Roseovarius sp.]
MRFTVVALILSTLLLSACGGGLRESRLNPANWFGRSTSVETEPATVRTSDGRVQEVNPLIGERGQSQLIAANRKVTTERTGLFGRKKEVIYQGTLISQVTDLTIEPTATGAIVRAVGVTSRQGAYDVRLLPLFDGEPRDGVLTYEFLALQPINTPQGPEHTRRIQAAQPLSHGDLAEIRTIRVIAKRNTRQSARR